jgi:two-component system, chemotaxis family, CheB/CheR fusion protein
MIQHVIAALADGSRLSSTQIAEAVSRASGKTVSPSDISGPLKKISDPDRSDLGHFVGRKWGDGTYVYRLVPEARALTEAQLYDLTWKRGADRYALADALAAHPDLGRYVDAPAAGDDPAPTPEPPGLFVVGIGASAGGLEAIYSFLGTLTADSGLGYVIISHRSKEKDHDGDRFLELIGKRAPVAVQLAEAGMALEPNRIYVAPRTGLLGIDNECFTVTPTDGAPDETLPIDAFFKSMALDLGERAVGVVLSGMGADGTAGMREIKQAFGLCVAQRPDTARYDSMPENALRHVSPDYTLPPDEIPQALVHYFRHAADRRRSIPDETDIPEMLPSIFSLLKNRLGHDFSGYKESTSTRRVTRRMAVHGMSSARHYLRLLQESKPEVDALFRELLIGVTSFFRDADAFDALKDSLTDYMEKRPESSDELRVWVAGCSTGEEAYSVAIILKECMETLDRRFEVQVFASDLSGEAVERARESRYPKGIVRDMGAERLSRYFEEEDDDFRVKKEIRDMLIFAPHNIIKDPPFTRLDLLCCRNLLIYLNGGAQKRLLPIFHYALKENGLLFLGTSETVGGFTDLFEPVNAKMRIYRRRPARVARRPLFGGFQCPTPEKNGDQAVSDPEDIQRRHRQALLRHAAPVSVLIDPSGDIVSVYGQTSPFLELPEGPATTHNLFKMAKNGLKLKLPAVVRQAAISSASVRFDYPRVRVNGEEHLVRGAAIPLTDADRLDGLILVTLEDRGIRQRTGAQGDPEGNENGDRQAEDVEKELQRTRQNLQITVEELETSNEELKSTNEELQSANEELQSSNEELESAKEEQQSLNEELATVNSELQMKIDELSEANQHMINLLENLQIPILFLDNDLKIRRFTSPVADLIKVIPSDVGRPLSDIVTSINGIDLSRTASEVLSSLVYQEHDVRTHDGRWYRMRVFPYRTQDNVIDGVLITLLSIQEQVEALKASDEARRFAEAIVDTVREPLLVLDGKLSVLTANRSFYETFRLRAEDVEGQSIYEICEGAWDIAALRTLLDESIRKRHFFSDFSIEHRFPVLGHRQFMINTRRLTGQTDDQEKILMAMEDVTNSE